MCAFVCVCVCVWRERERERACMLKHIQVETFVPFFSVIFEVYALSKAWALYKLVPYGKLIQNILTQFLLPYYRTPTSATVLRSRKSKNHFRRLNYFCRHTFLHLCNYALKLRVYGSKFYDKQLLCGIWQSLLRLLITTMNGPYRDRT